jgi:uncharacterized protein YceH (UPF0502 family)
VPDDALDDAADEVPDDVTVDVDDAGLLTFEELRVVGSLAEKESTTPDQYPLTLNALLLSCNQRSSRDPVVNFDEATVEAAVTSAKTKGFARFVHPSHGRSAIRFAHTIPEALGLSQRQVVLLAVLMLRGPQTPGELRARTERMAEFSDLEDLERELARLSGLERPLVERLARRPGQSQDRFRHLLGDLANGGAEEEARWDAVASPAPGRARSGSRTQEISDLERQVAALRDEMAQLREQLSDLGGQFDDLRRNLGG